MAFLTIEIKCEDADGEVADYTFPEARRYSLLRALQTYLSHELKRDFDTMAVDLTQHPKGNLIVAACKNPMADRKPTKDEAKFLSELGRMLSPEYLITDTGDIQKMDGTPIPGLGIDWRGAMLATKENGPQFLIGLVETVRNGADSTLAAMAAEEAEQQENTDDA